MFKLMKLEMKKFKLIKYRKVVAIADLIILSFIFFISYTSKYDNEAAMDNYQMVFSVIDTFVRATFIIFVSVIISRIIIDEYKNKTITVLFLYPIDRKKIIMAKLIIVVIFAFTSIILSNVLIGTGFYIGNEILHLVPDNLTMDVLIASSKRSIIYAFASSFISLIPLYFGMRKKSVPATIVSATILVSVICSNNNGFNLYSILAIPFSLAAVGIFIGYLTIKNIEHVDAVN